MKSSTHVDCVVFGMFILLTFTLLVTVVTKAFASLKMTNDFWVVCGECPRLLYRLIGVFADKTEEASIKVNLGHISRFKECLNLWELPVRTVSRPLYDNGRGG